MTNKHMKTCQHYFHHRNVSKNHKMLPLSTHHDEQEEKVRKQQVLLSMWDNWHKLLQSLKSYLVVSYKAEYTKPPHGPNRDQILRPDSRESLLTDSNCLPRPVFCYHPWGTGCYGSSAIHPSSPSYVQGTSSQPWPRGVFFSSPATSSHPHLSTDSRQKDETGVKSPPPGSQLCL